MRPTRPAQPSPRAARFLLPLLAGVLAGSGALVAASPAASAAPIPHTAARTTIKPALTTSTESDLCPTIPGHMRCLAVRRRIPILRGMQPRAAGTVQPATSATMYGPADLRSAYQIPATGSTATVAIIDAYDAPTLEADLAAYRAFYGLPACTTANGCFSKLNESGDPTPLPSADVGWSGETTLDVQMVSAVCPTCHITVYEADSSYTSDMLLAARAATTAGAKYVSMSWGGAETPDETFNDANYLNTPGVAYVAAAGDNDFGTSWPAVSPAVVSVGGTSLTRSSTARGWTESVWGYSDGTGTGSGCSQYEPLPSWQAADATLTGACPGGRAMNDVSVDADPATGVAVYQGGSWYQYGGTSAGAPMIAAMYALAGTSANAPAAPYAHRAAFNDIADYSANSTTCQTQDCYAGPGWDGPTGIGTPIGLAGFGGVGIVTVHNPGTVTSFAGTGIAINTRAVDTTGAALTYAATGLPPGTWVRSDGYLVGAPARAGAYTVTVRASDTSGLAGAATFRWNVRLHRIVPSAAPRIAGTAGAYRVVTAAFGTWRADTAGGVRIRPSQHIQWYLDGRPIRGATGAALRISAAWRLHTLTYVVSAYAPPYYAPYAYRTPAVRIS